MNIVRVSLIYLVIPIVVLWLLFILTDQVVMPLLTRHGNEFPLPYIVGKPQADAEELFLRQGLVLQIAGREYSPNKPEGVILTQLPQAGTMVKEGRNIKAIISAGVRVVTVPVVFGLPIRQANLALQKIGFVVGDMYWTDVDSLPENVAVETIPSAGTLLPLASTVSLAINQGSRRNHVFMPALVGKPLPRARGLLDSLGLYIAELAFARDTLLLPNTVVEQQPTRNTQIQRGDSIRLTVSMTE